MATIGTRPWPIIIEEQFSFKTVSAIFLMLISTLSLVPLETNLDLTTVLVVSRQTTINLSLLSLLKSSVKYFPAYSVLLSFLPFLFSTDLKYLSETCMTEEIRIAEFLSIPSTDMSSS